MDFTDVSIEIDSTIVSIDRESHVLILSWLMRNMISILIDFQLHVMWYS